MIILRHGTERGAVLYRPYDGHHALLTTASADEAKVVTFHREGDAGGVAGQWPAIAVTAVIAACTL